MLEFDLLAMFGSHFILAFEVGFFGVFEDVDEMFASADDFPRLIHDGDGFHERHVCG